MGGMDMVAVRKLYYDWANVFIGMKIIEGGGDMICGS